MSLHTASGAIIVAHIATILGCGLPSNVSFEHKYWLMGTVNHVYRPSLESLEWADRLSDRAQQYASSCPFETQADPTDCDGARVNMGVVYDKVPSFDGRQAKNFLLVMTAEEEGLSDIYSTTAITSCSDSCLGMLKDQDLQQLGCGFNQCESGFTMVCLTSPGYNE